jgi:hypothetical protein
MCKKQHFYYSGQGGQKIQNSQECVVNLRNKMKRNSTEFNFPDCEDKYPVPVSRTVSKLQKPV